MRISHRSPAHARGFSLVEIMVGLVIGMIGMVIMLQIFADSEEKSRTTGSGNDALVNGAIALHGLQRDISEAGYGFASASLLGCNITVNGVTVPLAPVTINAQNIPAGDANTDTLLVMQGSANGQPHGNRFTVDSTDNKKVKPQAPASFAKGEYVIAAPASCAGGALTLNRVPPPNEEDSGANPDASGMLTLGLAVAADGVLYNLGQAPQFRAYRIRNGALTTCDLLQNNCSSNADANWTPVGGNIVGLRAQYGWGHNVTQSDTTIAAVLDSFTDTAPTNCSWPRIPAVRLAVVSRSAQYETRIDPATGARGCDPVTAAAPTWTGSTAGRPAGSTARTFNLSGFADWQCYRYKVFETVAPLRNIVWMGVQAGC